MIEKRETVGKIASELMQKEPESRDPIEIERVLQKDLWSIICDTVADGKKLYPGQFFVQVITKNEPLMPNVFRNQVMHLHACPTPNYDQSVFRYDPQKDAIEYIWTIPCRETCFHLKMHALEVVPEERDLLNFVLDFADGTLYRLARKLNNEPEI